MIALAPSAEFANELDKLNKTQSVLWSFQMIFLKAWLVVSLANVGNPLAREIVEFTRGAGS